MLDNILRKLLSVDRENRLLIFIGEDIGEVINLRGLLLSCGYSFYEYRHVETFRVLYEEQIKHNNARVAIVVARDIYVPYDLRRAFYEVSISASTLFPNLNADVVMRYRYDWDIVSFAVLQSYADFSQAKQTENFISDVVFSYDLIERYYYEAIEKMKLACESARSYQDWIPIAKNKASIEYYAAMKNVKIDMSYTDDSFGTFITDGYSRLSSEVNNETPPIVTKAWSVIMADKNAKSALIVMDGMSLFDFKVISQHFGDIKYDYGCTYALIPTTTPISRQSLLSGKYPRELPKPFSLVNEEKEFKSMVTSFGLTPAQVDYLSGYEAEISPLSKVIAIVINEVDDITHGQHQDRTGMWGDMDLLGRSGKLQGLIKKLTALGYSTYITSDHGNTLCTGVGGFRSGVEVESRSKRMAILKGFAETNTLLKEHATEYPGFYLDQEYRYFVCKNGVSFDHKGDSVMTHGGTSIDEVIVPFIKVRRG